jgi:hypothetical protein
MQLRLNHILQLELNQKDSNYRKAQKIRINRKIVTFLSK